MSKSNFRDYVIKDVLCDIPGIVSRAMFGGHGIYKDGIIFAIIADDKLYFKVNDSNKKDYESRGSSPFTYATHKGKQMSMAYWELPEDILESRDDLSVWVEKAVQASVWDKTKKPKKK